MLGIGYRYLEGGYISHINSDSTTWLSSINDYSNLYREMMHIRKNEYVKPSTGRDQTNGFSVRSHRGA